MDELPEQFEDQTPIQKLLHGHAIMLSALCEIIDTMSYGNTGNEPDVEYINEIDQLHLI